MQGGGTCEPNQTPSQQPDTHTLQNAAKRPRHKESTEVELRNEEGTLPQSDYEGSGEFYVGRRVNKSFNGIKYRGVVTNCDVDNVTGGEFGRLRMRTWMWRTCII